MSVYHSRRHCATYEIRSTIKRLNFLSYISLYLHLFSFAENEINYVLKSNIVCFCSLYTIENAMAGFVSRVI